MRPEPDALMVFAAGFGTRMGVLTRTRPKPLIEVGGRALLDHALALAEGAGIGRVVANTHYLGAQIARHLDGRGVDISAEAELLDTGGGLRRALPRLGGGPVFTLNADAVWTGPNVLAALRAAWDPARMGALLALVPAARAGAHAGSGDFALGADGRIRRGGDLVYTGAQIVETAGLAAVPQEAFSLNLLWDALIAEGRVHGLVHSGGWCDVGHPDGIAVAEEMLAAAAGERARG